MTSPFGEENVLQLDVPTVQDLGQRLHIVNMIESVVTSEGVLDTPSHCDMVLVIPASLQPPENTVLYGVNKLGFLHTRVRQPVKMTHSYAHVSWKHVSIDDIPRDHLSMLQRVLQDYLSQ